MRKLWLTFTAMLFCSIASFAQTPISTKEDFMAIPANANGNYILMNDIDLGTYHATSNNFIIDTLSGTFDGNNHTITYKGSFTVANNAKVGLFGTVSGTIKNLNLDADITVSGEGSDVNVGLLCGTFQRNTKAKTVIEFCDVTGNINSTVKAGTIGHSSTGLIVGSNLDTLQYCTGHGNVTGVGYVGGLVGSMGTVRDGLDNNEKPLIKGCYFTGNVTANNSSTQAADALASILNTVGGILGGTTDMEFQSFGGGICGTMRNPAKIELCVAEAIVVVGQNAAGITTTSFGSTALGWGSCGTAQSNYATGTINGTSIGSDDLVDKVISSTNNPAPTNSPNYPTNSVTNLQTIVDNLNAKRCPNANNCDDNFYFVLINGKVVLVVGQPITHICETPKNLTVTVGANGAFTASWSVNNQDNTVYETTFRCSLKNNGETIQSGTTTAMTLSGTLETSAYPYILTIESDCSAEQNGLYSDAISYTFYVDANCLSVTGLQVTNVNPTTVNVSWEGTADTIKLNGSVITLTNEGTIEGLTPGTEYSIEAIVNCTRHEGETEVPYQLSTTVTFVTEATDYVTAQTGNFNSESTWVGGKVPTGNAGTTITIREGHQVTLDGTLVLHGEIINKGVLIIPQSSGQLINMTENNDFGIVEIVTGNKEYNKWTFVGAPFENNYKLGTIYPMDHDVAVSRYNYGNANWNESWETVGTEIGTGEGYLAWPFYGGVIIFTTYGDVCKWNTTTQQYEAFPYDFTKTPDTKLYNGDTTITKEFGSTTNGRWMALANPYPAKLSVSKFVADNTDIAEGTEAGTTFQGKCIYKLTNNVSNNKQTWDVVFDNTNEKVKDIAMTEGFFVNLASGNSVTFSKEQLTNYPDPTQAKSQVAPREFVELSLVKGNYKSKLYFAHNQEAEQNYDIFDANKLFALGEVAEPYFVTDGIALVKEEAKELPYYATMNVRSFANDTVSFVVNNIPEGLAVSIIDGENIIDMVEGGVYTTEILTGENADRFKVLIKKSVSISDVEELEVNITNNNRHISIATTETDLQVEVYNALGQKVFSTKDRNFTLNQVSAGAYLIKAFNNKASKTQKIVVE